MALHFPDTKLQDGSTKFGAISEDHPMTWAGLLDGLRAPEFALAFSKLLAGQPHAAFRWECPPLTPSSLDQEVEFVITGDGGLDRPENIAPFARELGDAPVATFTNLGGDSTLVVPNRIDNDANHTHIASFVGTAPERQQVLLWSAVSVAVSELLSTRPIWLSTAGGGVAWLHVRIDQRPKYYRHTPYKK